MKIKIWRVNKTVCVQFLEFDLNKYRAKGDIYKTKNGVFTFKSTSFPELNFHTLYLPGDNEDRDNNPVYTSFNTEENAKLFLNELRGYIEELKLFLKD